jgi:hypothetical protein
MFASVPAGLRRLAEDAQWSRGMAMSMKEKLLFFCLLAGVVFSLAFRDFWAGTFYVLGRIVALNLVSLPSLAKFAVVICGVHLLP